MLAGVPWIKENTSLHSFPFLLLVSVIMVGHFEQMNTNSLNLLKALPGQYFGWPRKLNEQVVWWMPVITMATDFKQHHHPNWDCGGWVPETSWSYHYWQPAPRWRPHWWLAKPDNPAMSPHALDKIGTRHTDIQWKVKWWGRELTMRNKQFILVCIVVQCAIFV